LQLRVTWSSGTPMGYCHVLEKRCCWQEEEWPRVELVCHMTRLIPEGQYVRLPRADQLLEVSSGALLGSARHWVEGLTVEGWYIEESEGC
jgi:hypothetical protein